MNGYRGRVIIKDANANIRAAVSGLPSPLLARCGAVSVLRASWVAEIASACAKPGLRPPARKQKTMPVIGYLGSGSAKSEAPFREPFLKGLEQSGFLAGRNVGTEYRFAEGR